MEKGLYSYEKPAEDFDPIWQAKKLREMEEAADKRLLAKLEGRETIFAVRETFAASGCIWRVYASNPNVEGDQEFLTSSGDIEYLKNLFKRLGRPIQEFHRPKFGPNRV